ncbi:MAG: DNA topoisomerase IB, partial [Psychrobacter sp.]|nr:DNA topoisomerase IB [Psychrobacter sp.]
DERLIDIIQACSELPGYRIFKYIDEHGDKQVVDSSDVNDYLRQYTGTDYSAKDFRTWMASVLAASYLYEQCQNDDEAALLASEANSKEREQYVVDMVKTVAGKLGNTPSVCRSSYIHPKVIDSFLNGTFYERYKSARRGRTKAYQHTDEKALLGFLKSANDW